MGCVPRRGAEIWTSKVPRKMGSEPLIFSSLQNFGGPYLGSPTWHRGRSVLKIIVWSSSLLTNIFLPLRKHNKATRVSEVSQVENFEHFKFSTFGPKNPIFLLEKAANGYRTAMPSISIKISHWGDKTDEKMADLQ